MTYQADVVIVGAGATGSSIARELAKYNIDVIVVDKNEDVGGNASRGNPAALVCGADQPVGSLAGRLQNASNRMYDTIAKELDVEIKNVGRLCVALKEEEVPSLEELRKKAIGNNVYNTVPLSASKVREMVPMITDQVVAGLWTPDDKIVDLFQLVYANMQNAMENGVRVLLSAKVTDVVMEDFCIKSVVTTRGEIKTKFVINAMGVNADELAKKVGICDYRNYPRTGQFYLLDKNLPYMPAHPITPIGNKLSRGILLTPTVHGNLLVGPSAENGWDRDDYKTTREVLDKVLEGGRKLVPAINSKDTIRQFTGMRPTKCPVSWQVRATEAVKGYIEAVGITGAISGGPALAAYVAEILLDEGLKMKRKEDFNPIRVGIRRFNQMSEKERGEYIKRNPNYGNVICRCETVTEGEIIEAIHRMPGARSVDAVKRRLRAGMGRCQGGFCSPRVVEILARELKVPVETICKNEKGSEMVAEKNRKGAEDHA